MIPNESTRPLHARRSSSLPALAIFSLILTASAAVAAPRSPEGFVDEPIGQDRMLLPWATIVDYMRHLDAESERVRLVELGRSTEGRPFLLMLVADEAGLRESERHRQRTRALYEVDDTDEASARAIAREGRGVVAISLGVHSTEVGASQASLEMVYGLATREDPVTRLIRERLLVLIVPSMNPDGLDLVNGWYAETVGTEAEGTRPIDLYHPYAGHDNNRDGFFNNLVETQLWSRMLYHDWLPQMILDEHQMGSSGPRLFLPPFDDPLSPSVHPLVYSQLSAAGQQVVSDLTALGHRGIATQTIFTGEWPGSVRSTGFWHNMLGILSEVASARLATPLYFPPGSLESRGRGLPEYERRSNFLEPWPGGWWRLRDIIDLELDLTWGFLRWAAERKEDLLFNFWRMNRDAVEAGRADPPYAFVVPWQQHDGGTARRLAKILHSGGVEVHAAAGPLRFGDHFVEGGAFVVRTDQPFRPFVLEMLGRSTYPMVRDGGVEGEVIRPYDVTAWRLPDLLGARVLQVDRRNDLERMDLALAETFSNPTPAPRADVVLLPTRDAASFAAVNLLLADGARVERLQQDGGNAVAGDFVVHAGPEQIEEACRVAGAAARHADEAADATRFELEEQRVGLFSPWGGSMDEGWTRLVFDRHHFQYRRLRPSDLALKGPEDGRRLRRDYDVLVLPSISADELETGRQAPGRARVHEALWPEAYRGGLGEAEAGAALGAFAEAGGTVVVFNHAVDWAVEHMGLPVRLALQQVSRDDFYAPGTLVRGELDVSHPLAWGMPHVVSLYFNEGEGLLPVAWPRPTDVVVRYADDDLEVAGFLHGEQYLRGLPALAEIPVGEGQVVLFAFSPQRRAQTEATFKLVFNALLRGAVPPR